MAEKVIRLNPRVPFFLEGLHLVNPEKPYVILPEHFVPTAKIAQAIKRGVLIDVNQNILVDEKAEAIKAKAVKQEEVQAPKEEAKEVVEETPVEVVTEEATEEVVEAEKPKAKTKKTTAKK